MSFPSRRPGMLGSLDIPSEDDAVVLGLGVVAAIAAWLGWLTICPALGFPTLATAPMFNRVLVPKDDPSGSWFGWALLLVGLAIAALLYLVIAARGRLRPSIASGLAYGVACWAIAGAVVMPLLGIVFPSAGAAAPSAFNPPDPMHGSFMMLHLGIGAPIAALIAWLVFGAVIGAAAGWRAAVQQPTRGWGLIGAVSIVTLIVLGVAWLRVSSFPDTSAVTATRTLVSAQPQALPQGTDYFSVLELAQPPGAELGPHAHPYAGFAYSLKGVSTLEFTDGRTVRVAPGDVGLIGTQAAHTHLNTDDRLPTAALALVILGLAGVVCLIGLRAAARDRRLLLVVLVQLAGAGVLGMMNPWSNDWVFLSVRAVSQRGAPMPLPTASRVYESPDIGALPGRYVQTVEEITLAPGGSTETGSAGAAILLGVAGRADVQPVGGSSVQVGARTAMLLQSGTSARITNTGTGPARFLRFAVVTAPGS